MKAQDMKALEMETQEMETKHGRIDLSQLKTGTSGIVGEVHLQGMMRRRIMDLGLIPGTAVKCVCRGPSGDPTAYMVRGTTIALRNEDAAKINIYPI